MAKSQQRSRRARFIIGRPRHWNRNCRVRTDAKVSGQNGTTDPTRTEEVLVLKPNPLRLRLLSPDPKEAQAGVGLRESPLVRLQRPRAAGDGKPVGDGQRFLAFQRIEVVGAEAAPVKLQSLSIRYDGNVKRKGPELPNHGVTE